MKICSKCKEQKDFLEFNKRTKSKDGYRFECKKCQKILNTIYINNNFDRIKIQKKKYFQKPEVRAARTIYLKEYRNKNREKINKRVADWCKKNPDKVIQSRLKGRDKKNERSRLQYYQNKKTISEAHKQYEKTYRDRRKELRKLKIKNNFSYKIALCLRAAIPKYIKKCKGSVKAGSAVKDLGCSIKFLKSYLESKFQTGMSWENHGIKGWHIDHVKPLASFDLTNPEQFKRAVHYTNLQPLWWYDNLSKGAKY